MSSNSQSYSTKQYFKNIITALSVLLNAVTGGKPYEPFSSRQYRHMKMSKPNIVFLIDFVLGKDHCMEAYIWYVCRFEQEHYKHKYEVPKYVYH